MSLNWNATNVKNWSAIKQDNTTNEVIIFATMFVGIDTITEQNSVEFYNRLHMMEQLYGAYRTDNGKPVYFTQAEISARIGLNTNASNFSRAQLWRNIQKRSFNN